VSAPLCSRDDPLEIVVVDQAIGGVGDGNADPMPLAVDEMLRNRHLEGAISAIVEFGCKVAPETIGDAVARRILRQQGKTLGDYALVAARQVGLEGTSYPLVLAGSVFGHSYKLMNDTLVAHVRRQSPAVRMYHSELQPVAGAVIMALEGAGTRCTSLVRKRLRDTMPGAEFFAT